MVEHALKYLPRALPLDGKRPAVGGGWPSWPATAATIHAWWDEHPDDNVGIRTGGGLVVLDVDPRHGGDEALAEFERTHGMLPETPLVATGGNGWHHYFRGDARSCEIAPGLEVKAAGRQVVAPSIHPDTGREYVWIWPLIEREIAPLPGWLAGPPRRTTTRAATSDALMAIPASTYIRLLTGQEAGRDGKVTCPFHPDRQPSLHVYDDGWYCFQCCRGGSIIDLGAALWGVEPRGRSFHELRRRLARELLEAIP